MTGRAGVFAVSVGFVLTMPTVLAPKPIREPPAPALRLTPTSWLVLYRKPFQPSDQVTKAKSETSMSVLEGLRSVRRPIEAVGIAPAFTIPHCLGD